MAKNSRESFLERLPALRDMQLEDRPWLTARVGHPAYDAKGTATSMAYRSERFMAFAAYRLDGDIEEFRTRLTRSVNLARSLLDRFDAGEPIAPSYVSMGQFTTLLDAFAAGGDALALPVAERLGGRGKLEIDNDMPVIRTFGYALKSITLGGPSQAEDIARFRKASETKAGQALAAYGPVLTAIAERRADALGAALPTLVTNHLAQCRGGRMFDLTEDQALFGWGLGLLNLARSKGMAVHFDDPMLPAQLQL